MNRLNRKRLMGLFLAVIWIILIVQDKYQSFGHRFIISLVCMYLGGVLYELSLLGTPQKEIEIPGDKP